MAHLELSDDDVRRIAVAVAALVVEQLGPPRTDRWLTTAEAAEYLGMTMHALRHLISRRAVPYAQDGPGAKLYFKMSELDEWRNVAVVSPR